MTKKWMGKMMNVMKKKLSERCGCGAPDAEMTWMPL